MLGEVVIIAILKRVEYIGFTIQPYMAQQIGLPYLVPDERITHLNIDALTDLPETAVKIFRLSEEIEPHALISRFTKKKLSIKEFFTKNERLQNEIIKPFIDSKLYAITELLIKSGIPLYDAQAMPHFYATDQISIEEQKARTTLNFDRKEDGTIYRLEAYTAKSKINLQNTDNYLLTNSPCILFHNRKLVLFESNITGKILTPFLQKQFIQIPKHLEYKYFSSFITRLVNNSEIIASGFSIQDVVVQPAAFISLEKDWQDIWCLVLKYKYGEKTFPADNAQKNVTELKADEKGFAFYRSKRNKVWENEKKRALKDSGLTLFNNCYRLIINSEPADLHAQIDWLTENAPQFMESGIEIDQATMQQFVLSKPGIKQAVAAGNDWFDTKIIVLAGGFEIPFAKLRHHILDRSREYILPDGRLFLIPNEWFEHYHELLIHSVSVEENLRLHKHHFRILQDLSIGEIESFEEKAFTGEAKPPKLSGVTLRPYQLAGYNWMVNLSNIGFGGILADDMGLGKTLQAISLLSYHYHHTNFDEKDQEYHYHITPDNENNQEYHDQAIQKKEMELQINRGTQSTGAAIQLSLFDQLPAIHSETSRPAVHTETSWPAVHNETSRTKSSISKTEVPVNASLIVMPASLIHNWVNELNRFAPFLKKLVYTGATRKKTHSIFKNHQVILTTYGTLRNDIEFLSGYKFAYTILDEGQQIKNPSSLTAQAVFNINSDHKFVLTGTPVENTLTDLWSQMNFVNPGLLGNQSTFNTYYTTPLTKDPASIQAGRLLSIIQPFIMRRTKESVAPELPELTVITQYCNMTDEQAALYESEKSKIRNLVFEQIEQGNISSNPIMVLKALMQLRQIANHPLMIDRANEAGSGKFEEITSRLDTLIAERHRVLIFSSFVKHLSIIEEYCKVQGIGYAMLTGSTSNRGKVVSEFKDQNKKSVFLISLKAGGVGLNLTEADYVFMLDPWWNPAAEMQAINRAHRIGQSKNVFVYRFITKDTIEEKIILLQQKKKELADAFIRPQSAIAGMSREEIMKLFE